MGEEKGERNDNGVPHQGICSRTTREWFKEIKDKNSSIIKWFALTLKVMDEAN